MGAAYHRGSILASHHAAPGSNPGSAKIFLLSLGTVLRLNPSRAKLMQLAVTSRAKYYEKGWRRLK